MRWREVAGSHPGGFRQTAEPKRWPQDAETVTFRRRSPGQRHGWTLRRPRNAQLRETRSIPLGACEGSTEPSSSPHPRRADPGVAGGPAQQQTFPPSAPENRSHSALLLAPQEQPHQIKRRTDAPGGPPQEELRSRCRQFPFRSPARFRLYARKSCAGVGPWNRSYLITPGRKGNGWQKGHCSC